MKDINIQIANTIAITIIGKEDRKDAMTQQCIRAKALARSLDGKILREQEFMDGFFLEVCFTNIEMMDFWKKQLNIQ